MADNKQQVINPVDKNNAFALLTRQNIQKLPAYTLTEGSSVSIPIPKTRYLQKVLLMVDGSFKVAHAANTSYTPARMAPYNLLKNIKLELNNGFNPFNVTGAGLYLYNLLRIKNDWINTVATGRSVNTLGVTSSVAGTTNTCRFMLELPVAINDRDPVGLIMMQNEEIICNVNIDFDSVYAAILGSAAGYTVSEVSLKVYPHVVSYTIPNGEENRPDISVIKLVHEQPYVIGATGDNIFKLPLGNTYRRVIIDCYDSTPAGFSDSDLTELQLILQQSDIPYSLNPKILTGINQQQYGSALPAGVFALDFTYQGLPNYGGSRDYIDTQRLSEFWLKLNAGKTGTCRIVYETLAQLRSA